MEAYLVISLYKTVQGNGAFTLVFLFPNLAYQNSVLSYSLLVSNMTSIHMSWVMRFSMPCMIKRQYRSVRISAQFGHQRIIFVVYHTENSKTCMSLRIRKSTICICENKGIVGFLMQLR